MTYKHLVFCTLSIYCLCWENRDGPCPYIQFSAPCPYTYTVYLDMCVVTEIEMESLQGWNKAAQGSIFADKMIGILIKDIERRHFYVYLWGCFFFALHKIPVFITGTISKVVTTTVLYIVSCDLMRLLFFRNKEIPVLSYIILNFNGISQN